MAVPRDALDIVEDEKLQTALHKAAWYGYRDICKILVENGASITRTDYQVGSTDYPAYLYSSTLRLLRTYMNMLG